MGHVKNLGHGFNVNVLVLYVATAFKKFYHFCMAINF